MVSASTYYFSSNASKEGEAEVSLGFKYAYVYHAGSLAFGSLMITIVMIARFIVQLA
jgi:hypothetical protein